MQSIRLTIFLLFISQLAISQTKPKLVVGIVVDQMRQEYLYRFQDRFGDSGFKRLMRDGYVFKNAHFNYVPTYTGPGHASVYTGTTPAYHGIIGNNWYDKSQKESVYCAQDNAERTVGSTSTNGQMSPRRLLTTTIGDEMRLATQHRSQVLGLSIKDRGAIFPAGHTGEAFWYDKSTGHFITSTYYANSLPQWIQQFNDARLSDLYLNSQWQLSDKLETYTASGADKTIYEHSTLKATPEFPYQLKSREYWMIPETPFGNEILTEVSLAALKATDLGEDKYPDLLAISFSSTDYIGHGFGPNSIELEDTYIKLDNNIALILDALDNKVGKGNYVVFLTADHAVADVPQLLIDQKVPAGYFDTKLLQQLNDKLVTKYGEGQWIENMSNDQIFLNRAAITKKGVALAEVQSDLSFLLQALPGVARAYPAHLIDGLDFGAEGVKGALVRGYNQKRSGDVLMVLEPGWLIRGQTGTTHGSAYTYDTHVPMIWYGLKQGESTHYHPITDIAPTLSMLLNIKLPNGATGTPLYELLD